MTRQEKNEALRKIPYADTMEELTEFADTLRQMWPRGYMRDGHTPWRCSKKELADTLLRFHYHFGYDYTKEEILKAAKRYIAQTEFDSFRRCVKYFVIKEVTAGEPTSDLATIIEAIRDDDSADEATEESWLNKLV